MASIVPPTIAELSALMRARTRGEFSDQGVFNAQTRPTDVQAQAMLDLATTLVATTVSADVPPSLVGPVGKAILFKAAVLIETSYYPEQANTDHSSYAVWKAQYDELIETLERAAPGREVVVPGFGSLPIYGRDGGPYVPGATPVDPWI